MEKTKLGEEKESELRRKVFIGGISKDTSEDDLEAYFAEYGEIDDILVNRSAKTKISKGCAFVLFKEQDTALRIINNPAKHIIKGKEVECKASHRKGSKKKEK